MKQINELALKLRSGSKLFLRGIALSASALLLLYGCAKGPNLIGAGAGNNKVHGGGDDDLQDTLVGDTLPCGNFRTQTQGGWGAVPHGNNPGTYLHANFAGAFPNGLTVGCNDSIHFTSAQAITDYLPAGGTPAVLTQSYTDPTSLKNNLASQVVTLTLSVQFDLYDPSFSGSSIALGDLVIAAGTFAGMTVKDVLAEANKVLGGCSTTYTPSQIAGIIASINQNFDDGTANGGFLTCPGGSTGPDAG